MKSLSRRGVSILVVLLVKVVGCKREFLRCVQQSPRKLTAYGNRGCGVIEETSHEVSCKSLTNEFPQQLCDNNTDIWVVGTEIVYGPQCEAFSFSPKGMFFPGAIYAEECGYSRPFGRGFSNSTPCL